MARLPPPEKEEMTLVARISPKETLFTAEDILKWLKKGKYTYEKRDGPENMIEFYVFGKPMEVRNAYAKEFKKFYYKSEQEPFLGQMAYGR